MKQHIVICGWMMSVTLCVCACNAETNVTISLVKSATTEVVASLPPRSAGQVQYLREFGYKYRGMPAYERMSAVVSNNCSCVFENFTLCATNDICRMVLLSAGWAYDDDYYINWFSNVLELARSGNISKEEFKWFRLGSRNLHLLGVLPMQYDRQGVSNIVLRMQEYTGETNYCQRILNGAAKEDAIRYLDSMR